ncbi:MAG: FHA domain-containing protein, partial [Polyangiaceae bacterium]|nr:FHA domain-containing protein [Polyangiaceae bacterium]
MWKLTIMDDEGKQTELPLSRGEYTFGRGEQNTVRLTDRNISRAHLVLRQSDAGAWQVEDLSSYNGCFVNGKRVCGKEPIGSGDLLQLGDYRLEIVDDAIAMVVDTEGMGATPVVGMAALRDRPDRLVVVEGMPAGTEYPLVGQVINIGRAEDADVSIMHSSVSRNHARIMNLGMGVYEIFDAGSSNGIHVNGVKSGRRVIEDDDEIELGDVRLRFVSRGRIFVPGTPPRTLAHMGLTSDQYGRRRRDGLGYMVAIGAAIGVAAVAAIVALASSHGSSVPEYSEPFEQTVLQEALKLSDDGRHNAAHSKLAELPVDSPRRSGKMVRAIADSWAEQNLERAKTSDPIERRELLAQVVASPFVSPEMRDKAQAESDGVKPDQGQQENAGSDPPSDGENDPDVTITTVTEKKRGEGSVGGATG